MWCADNGVPNATGAEEGRRSALMSYFSEWLNVDVRFPAVYRSKTYLKVTEDALDLYRDRYCETELKYKMGILKRGDLPNTRWWASMTLKRLLFGSYFRLQRLIEGFTPEKGS
jgi:hypothetical protein